ncbi:MAG: YggT family protein [Actinomycetota bacterium]
MIASALSGLLCLALTITWILLVLRVILSWAETAGWRVPVSGPVRAGHDLIIDVTEPLLRPLRKLLPPVRMIDGSALAAFVIVIVVQQALHC